jgi:hypothetical protein
MALGRKTGGRQKGSLNKQTTKVRKTVEKAVNAGLTPLEYMLRTMRNPKAGSARRDWAAQTAAPYLHPRLATLQSNVNLTGRLTLEALVEQSMALPPPANENAALAAPVEEKIEAAE